MTADPRTVVYVYFNCAISSGYTELFKLSHYGELRFYPEEGPYAVKVLFLSFQICSTIIKKAEKCFNYLSA